MTKIKNSIILLGLALFAVGCTNVRQVGKINGLDVTRITTRGVFSPSTTTIVLTDPNFPGSIAEVVANGSGPGFVPSVAQAGGIAGGAALLRPALSKTSVNTTTSANPSTTVNNTGSPIEVNAGGHQNGSIHHNN